MSPLEQRRLSARILMRLKGKKPFGQPENVAVADELGTWLVHTEGRRDSTALVTSALTLDTVARDPGMRMENALDELPMRGKGAQAVSKQIEKRTDEDKGDAYFEKRGNKAKDEVERRIGVVRAWVQRLHILTEADARASDVEDRLREKIMDRVFRIYNLSPAEKTSVRSKMGPK